MFQTFNVRGKRLAAAAGAVTAAAALGGTLLAAPAQAAPALPYGTVISPTGVNERQYPSTDSSVRGTLGYHAQVGLSCKVRAQNISGNDIWYLLRDRSVWVSAKYVNNTGTVRYCKDVMRSALDGSLKSQLAQG